MDAVGDLFMGSRSKRKYESDNPVGSLEVVKLTGRDRTVFINALLNPPKPNKNLKAATKRFFRLIGN